MLDAGLRGRRAVLDRPHQGAVGAVEAEGLRLRVVDVADADAEVAAADLALLAQLRQDLASAC